MAESQSQQSSSNELIFRIIVLAVAGILALGIVRLRFCYSVSLPAKPPMPEPQNVSLRQVTESLEANPVTYAGYLEEDSREYGVTPVATAEQMARMLPYRLDETRTTLDPAAASKVVEAAGLRLSVSVRDIKGTPQQMMVLGIENLTDKPLAYRVVTKPDRDTKVCTRKQHLSHNAVALGPGERAERSECIYRRGWRLDVVRVETIELSPLSFYYVSRIPPESVGVESRVSNGHNPPRGSLCSLMLSATVQNALDSGRLTWRDFIDFFARHRCDTYRFPEGYKAFSADGEKPLPVMPPS